MMALRRMMRYALMMMRSIVRSAISGGLLGRRLLLARHCSRGRESPAKGAKVTCDGYCTASWIVVT